MSAPCQSSQQPVDKHIKNDGTGSKSDNDNLYCECFSYIQNLTQNISDLTENYKGMSDTINTLQEDDIFIKKSVSSTREHNLEERPNVEIQANLTSDRFESS